MTIRDFIKIGNSIFSKFEISRIDKNDDNSISVLLKTGKLNHITFDNSVLCENAMNMIMEKLT